MAVEITKFKRHPDPQSAIIAEVDVFLSGMNVHLRKCRIIRSKKGPLFVGMPSYKDELEQWIHYYEFEGDRQRQLAAEILELCRDKIAQPREVARQEPEALDDPFIPTAPDDGVPF